MTIGPVEYILIAFPGNRFNGEIVPALADLVDSETVRIIDLVFVRKDADGTVTAFEYDAMDETAAFAELPGEAGGVIGEDDIARAGDRLEPDSSAALLIWEDLWAGPFASAVRASGGVIVAGERIPHEVVVDVLAEIDAGA
jgi:hypothetical protein